MCRVGDNRGPSSRRTLRRPTESPRMSVRSSPYLKSFSENQKQKRNFVQNSDLIFCASSSANRCEGRGGREDISRGGERSVSLENSCQHSVDSLVCRPGWRSLLSFFWDKISQIPCDRSTTFCTCFSWFLSEMRLDELR